MLTISERRRALIRDFTQTFGDQPPRLFSAPGRVEFGGNHTDHQRGRVLAAAVDLDALCAAAPNGGEAIRVRSMGVHEIDLRDPQPREAEKNTTAALLRGIAARCRELGFAVGGFDAVMTSDVLPGSGLSSSAAFENAVGAAIGGLFNGGRMDGVTIAGIGRYAENVYFGKPSGLMDQLTSAVGGLVMIDFQNLENPALERVGFDFAAAGHALCVTGPIGSHADLTAAYAAIPAEMRLVAAYFGKTVLREVDPAAFYAALPELYGKLPDRGLLRATHFFAENARVPLEAEALRSGDFTEFLRLVNESGRSSFQYLQNVCHGDGLGLAVALSESERILGGAGAVRVHGGGFAGTILAFVPLEKRNAYAAAMDRLFGRGSCRRLKIRAAGAVEIV